MMMIDQIIWHGTADEASALVRILAANCGCAFGPFGIRQSTCPAHEAFCHDQRFVDGLVFERRWWALHAPNAGLRVIRA